MNNKNMIGWGMFVLVIVLSLSFAFAKDNNDKDELCITINNSKIIFNNQTRPMTIPEMVYIYDKYSNKQDNKVQCFTYDKLDNKVSNVKKK
jgi:hypothetical protein